MSVDSRDTKSLPDLRYIRELARVVKQYGLGEVELETGDHRILLRRNVGSSQPAPAPAPAQVLVAATDSELVAAPAAPRPAEPVDDGDYITSPFVGTFYVSPTPEQPSYVNPGDRVAPGQTLCIIEAMKLFNEIEAEFPCIIEEVLVDNAQPVEYGAKLFRVRKQ